MDKFCEFRQMMMTRRCRSVVWHLDPQTSSGGPRRQLPKARSPMPGDRASGRLMTMAIVRLTLATLLLAIGAHALQQSIPMHRPNAAAAARTTTPEAFDLYPAPGSPPAPGADGWFKDFGKQKMDPAMLKAAGIGDGKPAKKRPQRAPTKKVAETEGSGAPPLAPVLAGAVAIFAVVLATYAN